MTDPAAASREKSLMRLSTPPEGRHFPRYTIHLPLELHMQGSNVPMHVETTDISRNGCYIASVMPCSVGTKIQAKLWLGETRIVVRGRIVTSHPQFGNGIMFLAFDGDGQQCLADFLDSLTPSKLAL
jgi:PilZ domain-containing protein